MVRPLTRPERRAVEIVASTPAETPCTVDRAGTPTVVADQPQTA
jgi:hypothetical protein